MATKEEILDAISNMTVLELKELLDAFEERFDVTAAAPVAVAAAAPAGGGGDDGGSLRLRIGCDGCERRRWQCIQRACGHLF